MQKCFKCNKKYENNFKFCPECGRELKKESCSRYDQLDEKYKNLYGVWKFFTEGDCEGRSTSELGIFEGYVDDIALHLKKQCFYKLWYSKVEIVKIDNFSGKGSVFVSSHLPYSLGKEMNKEEKTLTLMDVFKDRKVQIEDGKYYNSIKITR